jgi:hypothetical protein
LRAGADPDIALQPTLSAGGGVMGSPDRATNLTTSSAEGRTWAGNTLICLPLSQMKRRYGR